MVVRYVDIVLLSEYLQRSNRYRNSGTKVIFMDKVKKFLNNLTDTYNGQKLFLISSLMNHFLRVESY